MNGFVHPAVDRGMNAPLRRGMCPTLASPIATGDGLLARLNPVEAGLSAAQLIGIAEAARRQGNGLIEITARGSLQIRGLTAQSAVKLAAEVDGLGIAVRTGVPVETPPLAGLDPAEVVDPRPLAHRIREAIAAAGLEGRLGPKVSVVVDGGGRSEMDAVAADVRLTAMPDDVGRWQVAVAGNANSAVVLGIVSDAEASDALVAVLSEIAALGRQARARDLQQDIPVERLERLRSFAPPSVLPDISPSRGEISSFGRIAFPSKSTIGEAAGESAISPLEGEMSGRTEGGVSKHNEAAGRIPVGTLLPLTDSRIALPVALPFGSIHANDLADFIAKADANGITEFRLAPQRKLILLAPSSESAHAAKALAAQAGLIVDPTDPRAYIAACAGAPACASGRIPARRMAAEIAATLPPGCTIDLHVSGCEKRCARPGHDGLTLVGTADGIDCVRESTGRSPFATLPHGSTAAELLRAIFSEGTR